MQDVQVRQYPKQLILRGVQIGLQMVFFFVLARLLPLETFGTIALVAALLNVFSLLVEMGLEQALVQHPALTSAQLASSFWLSAGLSVLLTSAVEVASPITEQFFRTPGLQPLLRVCALAIPFSAISVLPKAILLRGKAFQSLAVIELSAVVLGTVAGMIFLIAGMGMWSYAAYVMMATTSRAVFFFVTARWTPPFQFSFAETRSLLSVGRNIQAAGLLNFFGKNLDTFIVGRFLGVVQLGLYNFAYRIIPLFQDVILGPMRQMVLSVYSDQRNDARQMYKSMCRDTKAVTSFSLPVLAFLGVAGQWIIPKVFGEQWSAAVPILVIFCLEAGRQTLAGLAPSAIVAAGRSDLIRHYAVVSLPVLVLAFIAGIPWGAWGVALSFLLFNSLLNIYLVILFRSALRVSLLPLCFQWIPGLGIASMFIVSYLILDRSFAGIQFTDGKALTTIGATTISLWGLKVLFPEAWQLLGQMLLSLFGRPGQPNRRKECIVYVDPLMNRGNPHLTILHDALLASGEVEMRQLKFTTFVLMLPWRRLFEFKRRLVAIHLHFINRFYESRSSVMAAARFLKVIAALAWCRIFGIRLVWTFHDDRAHDFAHRKTERVFLFWIIHLCDHILTLSERGREILWERYGRTGAVTFTPHPAYANVYPNSITRKEARARLGISSGERLYLFVGRVMAYKGLEDLVKTFCRWHPSAKVRLIIWGNSRPPEYGNTLAQLAQTDKRITLYLEFLPEEKVAMYLKAADFGVLPYRKILHSGTAMLFSTFHCPVIVPDIGWFPEIFQKNRIGIMYDAAQPAGLHDALDRSLLVSREDFEQGIGALCEDWNLERAAGSTLDAYRRL